jgi:hypothetical protein
MKLRGLFLSAAFCLSPLLTIAASGADLRADVRGVATRAPAGMKIDGDLSEWKDAFSTPVDYFSADLKNRAGQFFYMWDDEAFYAALRTLDQKPANNASDKALWEGDAVEWYFDTRRNDNFRGKDWGKGAVHCYWTGLKGTNVQPRFCLRPGYLDAIPKIGVEVGAKRTKVGMDVEFKLPWANFPEFKAAVGEVIALDAEMCSSDGGRRVDRWFVYGSPLSVQQPASQAPIQLVDKFEPSFWKQCGPVMTPIRCDTPWTSKEKGMVVGYMAVPPTHDDAIGGLLFRLVNLNGGTIAEFPGKIETFASEGNFRRARAEWPIDVAPPGEYQLLGIVQDKSGQELARVAPRMVSVKMNPGY